jgi:hypothetical protein
MILAIFVTIKINPGSAVQGSNHPKFRKENSKREGIFICNPI